MATPPEPRICRGSHRSATGAVPESGDLQLCRRHLNRHLTDQRISEYAESPQAPRCPDHPERRPRISRWESQSNPVLSCTAPTGEQIITRPSGRGAFRMGSRSTYTSFCGWQAPIPEHILRGTGPPKPEAP